MSPMTITDRLWQMLTKAKDEPVAFSKTRWRRFTVEPGRPNGWEIISTMWSAAGPIPDSVKSVGRFLPEFSEAEVREQAKALQDHYDAVSAQRQGL